MQNNFVVSKHGNGKWSIDRVIVKNRNPTLLNQEAFWYKSRESAIEGFNRIKKPGEKLIDGVFFINPDGKTYDSI